MENGPTNEHTTDSLHPSTCAAKHSVKEIKSAQISANDVMLLQYPWATVLKHKERHRSLEQHFG